MTEKPTYGELEQTVKDLKEEIRRHQSWEQKAMDNQKDLMDSGEQYRRTLDSLDDAIHVVDSDLRILFFNNVFINWNEKLGLETEVIGRNIFDIFPFLGDKVRDEYSQVFKSGELLVTEDRNLLGDREIITQTRKIPVFEEGRVTQIITSVRNITERVKAYEALHREKNFIDTALNSQMDTFFLFDPSSSKAIRWNKTFRDIVGYTDEEIASLPAPRSYYSPDDLERAIPFIENIMTEGSGTIELELICKDGRRIPTEYRVAAIYGDKDEPTCLISVGRDIAERKRVEETLDTMGDIVRAIPSGLFIYQFSPPDRLVLIDGNPATEELTGVKIDEWRGREFSEIWPKAQKSGVKEAFLNVMHTGEIYESDDLYYQDERLEGTFSVRVFTMPASRLGVVFENITERKQAEKALRESERKLRDIVEHSHETFYLHNTGHDLTYVSPRSIEVFGYTPGEMMRKWTELTTDNPINEKGFELTEKAMKTGVKQKPYLLEIKKKDGALALVEIDESPVKDDQGKVVGITGAARDVTDQKKAEDEKNKLQAQLVQAQKMEAIGTLAGGIAHDFNNLLMAAQGNISLMLYDIDSTHPHYELLKNIEKQIQNGSALTRQLLGYARKGQYDVKPIDLNDVVKQTSETFGRTRKNITTQLELGKNLLAIEADQNQIEQVLLNLYVNASDAMLSGGNLTLMTTNVSHKDIKGKLYDPKPGNYVLVKVTDTGEGIDKEIQARIFDPFFTTKEMGRGTGLGLASAYGIIKGHGGYIDVESEEGKGTTFSILLPATEKKVEEIVTVDDEILKGTETILAVDDEPMVLDVAVKILKRLGYTVLEAKSGREAIEIYEANKKKIDMVLLDIVMPDMDGGKAYDRMKELNPRVKVLLSSGYSIDSEAKDILARGCNGFIQKPFDMKRLSHAVRGTLKDRVM